MGRAHEWVRARVAGKTWWVRAPLLAVLMWILHRHLAAPDYTSIFGGLNLGFHEMGHAFFSAFGNRMLFTAGGTIFEIAVPVGAGLYLLLKQRDPFGASVCLFWLGTALVGIGLYAADARAQSLPLVSPFGPVDVDSHDWTVMLLKWGMLSKDQEIGAFFRRAGFAAMSTSLVLSTWILWIMAHTATQQGNDDVVGPGGRHEP
jgi:hypothetical protein